MDWNEIRTVGHACYNCVHLKERKRYWVFLLRCAFHTGTISELQQFFHSDPVREKVITGMPCLIEQATRAFFYKGATLEERSRLIRNHVELLQQMVSDSFLETIYAGHKKITLWTDTFQDKPLTLDVLFHPGQRKEGCLSLVLHWGEVDFYQIMFWLSPAPDSGKPCVWIGALQGTTLGNDAVKAMTKKFFGYRTKNLIFYGLRTLADLLGCEKIYAVTNTGYYAMNHVRMDRKLKTNFGDFWAECGGEPSMDERFYVIPLEEKRRDLSEMKPSKRANHRRRYELMDQMRSDMEKALLPWLRKENGKENP
jgi:uncharacterized protein VirK/YbjX